MPFDPKTQTVEEWKQGEFEYQTVDQPCIWELQNLEFDNQKCIDIWKASASNEMDLNLFFRHDLDEEAWNKDTHGQDPIWPEIKLTRMKFIIDQENYIPNHMAKQFHPDTRPYYWDFAQHDAGWAMHKHFDWRITGLVIPLIGGCPVIRYFADINNRRVDENGNKMEQDWREIQHHRYSGPCLLNGKEFHSADALPERRLIMHFMFDQTVEEIREKNPHLWSEPTVTSFSRDEYVPEVENKMPENYGLSYQDR